VLDNRGGPGVLTGAGQWFSRRRAFREGRFDSLSTISKTQMNVRWMKG
jgi:hypothetical protein